MDQLPETHAQVLVPVDVVVQQAPRLLVGQALLEAAEDLDVGELALSEPGLGDDAQALAEHAKELGAVGDDHDGLLHRGPGHVGGTVDELGRVELAGARDAE